MTDREKVIKGLEHCYKREKACIYCPYHGEYCTSRLARDAFALLKAQEPRLLTLDEVIAHYSLPPVFVDDFEMQEDYFMDIKPLYFDFPHCDEFSFVEHWRGYSHVRQYLDNWKASYGDKWVCWTDKPTDEQRRAVKCDEQAGHY
jgi:hypothetical protein